MACKKETAAEYIERHDGVMRIILGELFENASAINLWWGHASSVVRTDPDGAESLLIDAEIHLNHHVRIELSDSLRYIRSALSRLDAELPDEEDDHSTDPPATSRDLSRLD